MDDYAKPKATLTWGQLYDRLYGEGRRFPPGTAGPRRERERRAGIGPEDTDRRWKEFLREGAPERGSADCLVGKESGGNHVGVPAFPGDRQWNAGERS